MFPFTPHTTLRPDRVRAVPYFAHFEGCLVEDCLVEGCLVEGCLVEGCLIEGCLIEGCLVEGCLVEGCLVEGCLVEGCLVEGCLVERDGRSPAFSERVAFWPRLFGCSPLAFGVG
nr:hypothetical protein [Moorena sp. SIOASIH]